MTRGRQIVGLVGWVALCFAAGAVGGVASVNAGSFYQELSRPGWAPPSSLFGPVWSVLYLLMGIAAWLVWRDDGFRRSRGALGLFLAQLAANALWTWIFFAWREGALAFGEILVLVLLIVATIFAFRRVSGTAALLLVPYLGWVLFATALTYALWQRNPLSLS